MIRVGDARGFIVATEQGERFIITAAHCLPHLPPAHPASYLEERTYAKLVGRLGAEPTVWAECVFVDPVADLAVLCSPDDQELYGEAEEYDALVESARPLPVGGLEFTREPIRLEDQATILGPPQADSDAWLLSLEGQWFSCRVRSRGRALGIYQAVEPIRAGMSGSPIVTSSGAALGVVSVSASGSFDDREGGPNPELAALLPGWFWGHVTRAARPPRPRRPGRSRAPSRGA